MVGMTRKSKRVVMFKDLPQEIQTEVLVYLQANEFPKAKKVVDAYYETHPQIQQAC